MTTDGNGATPVVPPQPVPEVCQVAQAIGPDAVPHVVLVFHGPMGTLHHWLNGAAAEVIGKELLRLAAITKAGLHVPRTDG